MLTFLILVYVSAVLIAWAVGNSKGRSMEGIVYGLAFSWVGVIIVVCLRSKPGHGWSKVARAAWLADPGGQHEYRYWNGADWSEHVSDAGVQSSDALTAQR